MNDSEAKLNYFLVSIFNEILRVEEDCLRQGEFKNLSVREMHVIEAVSIANAQGENNRASDIAGALGVSAGTLTTAVALLEKKGCIDRRQDTHDKRIVRLFVTPKGERANAVHQRFHEQMVRDVISALTEDEVNSLTKGLQSLETFFNKNK